MNYYGFHIGDYRSATMHLNNHEDLAYRRALDWYYDTEKPIPLETQWVARRLRVDQNDLETVLNDFFQRTNEGWVHGRCEQEIANYHSTVVKNRINGKKGGRPKGSKPLVKKPNETPNNPVGSQSDASGPPVETHSEGNQEPRTKNQEPDSSVANATAGEAGDGDGDGDSVGTDPPKSADELTKTELWAAGKSLLEAAGVPPKQCGSFVGKLVKDYTEAVVVEAVRATVVARPADPAEYLKAACQRMVGLRAPALNTETAHGRKMREAAQGLAPGVARRTDLPTAPPIPVYEMEAHRAALPAGH